MEAVVMIEPREPVRTKIYRGILEHCFDRVFNASSEKARKSGYQIISKLDVMLDIKVREKFFTQFSRKYRETL